MATPVGRIEKEFLLKSLFDEKIPVTYVRERHEHILTLDQPANEELLFRHDKPIPKIKNRGKLQLLFSYRGQIVYLTVEILSLKENLIICKTPEQLYKNLDRNYLRITTPSDLKILFTFRGERYNLMFPKVQEYESIALEGFGRNLESHNLSKLVQQIALSLKKFADGYKIINFKDTKPNVTEERIISETGKALFIPSTSGLLPKADPYPKKRIVTEELFKRYLESTGVGISFLDDTITRFLKHKHEDGILSDAWVPILFQEYVIGYIHIWIEKETRKPFDFTVLDHVYQLTKVLAYSLKENGYFEHGKMENEAFEGVVLDISASGLLFAYPHSSQMVSTLLVDTELTVTIEAPYRTISVTAKIVRRFKDKSSSYFGCRFINMAPEDLRFLFEHLYGRQIDEADSEFLTGQV